LTAVHLLTHPLTQYRATLKAARPELSFGELSKVAGEKWRTLSPAEKEKYERQAQGDKDRHTREMAQYTPSQGFGSDGKSLATSSSSSGAKGKGKAGAAAGKKKKEKDPNAPKGELPTSLLSSSPAPLSPSSCALGLQLLLLQDPPADQRGAARHRQHRHHEGGRHTLEGPLG
jgi:hypothetical protein